MTPSLAARSCAAFTRSCSSNALSSSCVLPIPSIAKSSVCSLSSPSLVPGERAGDDSDVDTELQGDVDAELELDDVRELHSPEDADVLAVALIAAFASGPESPVEDPPRPAAPAPRRMCRSSSSSTTSSSPAETF